MRVNPDSPNAPISDTVTVMPGAKKRVHNVFIVDASGSMAGSRYETAISGLNELLKSIKADQFTENTVTIVEFEERRIERILNLVTKLPDSYKGGGCGGMTPLNEAIGKTCEEIRNDRNTKYSKEDKVLVNIFTDGGENNSSGKYKNKDFLSSYLKELEADGFTVTFQGTQNEVAYAVNTLGISMSNTSVHDNTAASIKRSFAKTVSAREMYSKSVFSDEDVTMNFYSKTIEPEDSDKEKK